VAGSGLSSRVNEIVTYDGSVEAAQGGDAVTIILADELDITRGDVLVAPTARPEVSEQFAAHIIWMDQQPLFHGRSYLIRVGTKTVPASITNIKYKIDVNTREHLAA
jgi:bifunctional enzyme CysN/CysC